LRAFVGDEDTNARLVHDSLQILNRKDALLTAFAVLLLSKFNLGQQDGGLGLSHGVLLIIKELGLCSFEVDSSVNVNFFPF